MATVTSSVSLDQLLQEIRSGTKSVSNYPFCVSKYPFFKGVSILTPKIFTFFLTPILSFFRTRPKMLKMHFLNILNFEPLYITPKLRIFWKHLHCTPVPNLVKFRQKVSELECKGWKKENWTLRGQFYTNTTTFLFLLPLRGDTLYSFEVAIAPSILNSASPVLILHPQYFYPKLVKTV